MAMADTEEPKPVARRATRSRGAKTPAGGIVKHQDIRTVTYPAGQPSPLDSGESSEPELPPTPTETFEDLYGVGKKHQQFIDMLHWFADKKTPHTWVHLYRTNPPQWDIKDQSGLVQHTITLDTDALLKSWSPKEITVIRDHTGQMFGGETYEHRLVRATGKTDEGKLLKKMTFDIDVSRKPPKPDEFTRAGPHQQPYKEFLASGGGANNIGIPDTKNELVEMRTYQQVQRVKGEIEDQEHNRWANKTAQQEERERREEALYQRRAGPEIAARREKERKEELELKEKQAKEDREAADRRAEQTNMTTMLSNTLAAALSNKGNDNGGNALLVAAIEAQSAQTKLMMEMIMRKQESKDTREDNAAVRASESANQMVTAMLEVQSKANARVEGIVDKLLASKMENPQDSVKQMLGMMEQGRSQMKEVFELVEAARGGGGDDEDAGYDPEAGFVGNMGSLAFHGIKKLMSMGGSPRVLQWLATTLNKPAGTTEFSDTEIAQAAGHVEEYMAEAPALPQQGFVAGQTAPQLAAPAPAAPAPAMVAETYEIDAPPGTAEVAQEIQAAAPAPAQTQMPPPIEEEEPLPVETPEERLRFHVNEMLSQAMADITDGRKRHEWPYAANESLNRGFLDQLAALTDPTERIKVIQQWADPALFEKLMQHFWQPGHEIDYHNFISGIHTLIQLHKGQLNAANA
jgi:hypothetical protein